MSGAGKGGPPTRPTVSDLAAKYQSGKLPPSELARPSNTPPGDPTAKKPPPPPKPQAPSQKSAANTPSASAGCPPVPARTIIAANLPEAPEPPEPPSPREFRNSVASSKPAAARAAAAPGPGDKISRFKSAIPDPTATRAAETKQAISNWWDNLSRAQKAFLFIILVTLGAAAVAGIIAAAAGNRRDPNSESGTLAPVPDPFAPGFDTLAPSWAPTLSPTPDPTRPPTGRPSVATGFPTKRPTSTPTMPPLTSAPTMPQTSAPTRPPSAAATRRPTRRPTDAAGVDSSKYNIQIIYVGGMSDRFKLAVEEARKHWEELIIGDLPGSINWPAGSSCYGLSSNENILVDDLLVYVTLMDKDGPFRVVGEAGPCSVSGNGESNFARVGMMRFDIADVDRMVEDGYAKDVIMHEMGHIFGLGTMWRHMVQDEGGTLVLKGEHAKRGHEEMRGIGYPLVDNRPGIIPGGHWDEKKYGREVMTPFVSSDMPISAMTLGALEDLGYTVERGKADEFFVSAQRILAGLKGQELLDDILPLEIKFITVQPTPAPEEDTTTGGRRRLRG